MTGNKGIPDIARVLYYHKSKMEREANYLLASLYWHIGEQLNRAAQEYSHKVWTGHLNNIAETFQKNSGALLNKTILVESQKVQSRWPHFESLQAGLYVIPWNKIVRLSAFTNKAVRNAKYSETYRQALKTLSPTRMPIRSSNAIYSRATREGFWFPDNQQFAFLFGNANISALKRLVHSIAQINKQRFRLKDWPPKLVAFYQSSAFAIEKFNNELNAVFNTEFNNALLSVGRIINEDFAISDRGADPQKVCRYISRELKTTCNLVIGKNTLYEAYTFAHNTTSEPIQAFQCHSLSWPQIQLLLTVSNPVQKIHYALQAMKSGMNPGTLKQIILNDLKNNNLSFSKDAQELLHQLNNPKFESEKKISNKQTLQYTTATYNFNHPGVNMSQSTIFKNRILMNFISKNQTVQET